MKRAWDSEEVAIELGSARDSASASSNPRAAASSSLSGPGLAKRKRRAPRQQQRQARQPSRPRQQAAGSSSGEGGGRASTVRSVSPVAASRGTAQEGAATGGRKRSQSGSLPAAWQPNTITTGLAAEPLVGSTAPSLQAPPLLGATAHLAMPRTPPTPAASVHAATPVWPPNPIPAPPLPPAYQWPEPPAISATFLCGQPALAGMPATPAVRMLHLLVPLAAPQQWPLQAPLAGGPWRPAPAAAAWQGASSAALGLASLQPLPLPLLQAPLREQPLQAAAAAAAAHSLWAELAQLTSPAPAPDTCSLRRYEEEQRRFEERWRQYQQAAEVEEGEEEGHYDRALQAALAQQRELERRSLAERALAQQAWQAQQMPTEKSVPTPAAQLPASSLPAVACYSGPTRPSPFAAAASASCADAAIAGRALPQLSPPAGGEACPAAQQQQRQQQQQQQTTTGLAAADSCNAELVRLYSAWQDGQASLSLRGMLPK
ncbi:hypothetical protein ABPG75_000330 [Micractinium tetrahymenae]